MCLQLGGGEDSCTVRNKQGEAVAVAHQYDRFPDLQQHLFRKVLRVVIRLLVYVMHMPLLISQYTISTILLLHFCDDAVCRLGEDGRPGRRMGLRASLQCLQLQGRDRLVQRWVLVHVN